VLVSSLGFALFSCPTSAAAAPFELAWSAPAGCPSRDDIVEATRARLGAPSSEAPPQVFMEGTVSEVPQGFRVRLTMKDAAGRQVGVREVRVDSHTCKEIEGQTSLVLAMMIASGQPQRAEAPATPDEPVEAPATEPPPALPMPDPPAEPAPNPPTFGAPARPFGAPARPLGPKPDPAPHRLLVGAAAVASHGGLPTTAGGVAVRALYSPGGTVLFGLEASAERSASVHAGSGTVAFTLFGASARLGVSALRTSRFELVPMLGARLALIQHSPRGYQEVHQRLRATVVGGGGVLLRFEVARSLFVEALPEIGAILARDGFRVREGDKLYLVHRPSALEARLSLGIGYEFR